MSTPELRHFDGNFPTDYFKVRRGGVPPAPSIQVLLLLGTLDLVSVLSIDHRGRGGHKKSEGEKGPCPKHLACLILFLEDSKLLLLSSVKVSTDSSPH